MPPFLTRRVKQNPKAVSTAPPHCWETVAGFTFLVLWVLNKQEGNMCDGDGRGTNHTAGGLRLQPQDWMCWRGTGPAWPGRSCSCFYSPAENIVWFCRILCCLHTSAGKQENMGGRETETRERERESERGIEGELRYYLFSYTNNRQTFWSMVSISSIIPFQCPYAAISICGLFYSIITNRTGVYLANSACFFINIVSF